MTPLVEGFFANCREKNLSAEAVEQAVKTACSMFPEVADEFEKSGWSWGGFARGMLAPGPGMGPINGLIHGAVGDRPEGSTGFDWRKALKSAAGGGILPGLAAGATSVLPEGNVRNFVQGATGQGRLGEFQGGLAGGAMEMVAPSASPAAPEQPKVAAVNPLLLPAAGAAVGGLLGYAGRPKDKSRSPLDKSRFTGAAQGALMGGGLGAGAVAGKGLTRAFMRDRGTKATLSRSPSFMPKTPRVVRDTNVLGVPLQPRPEQMAKIKKRLSELRSLSRLRTATSNAAGGLGAGLGFAGGAGLSNALLGPEEKQAFLGALARPAMSLGGKALSWLGRSLPSSLNAGKGTIGHSMNQVGRGLQMPAARAAKATVSAGIQHTNDVAKLVAAFPGTSAEHAAQALQTFGNADKAIEAARTAGGVGNAFVHHNAVNQAAAAAQPATWGQSAKNFGKEVGTATATMVPIMGASAFLMPGESGSPPPPPMQVQASLRKRSFDAAMLNQLSDQWDKLGPQHKSMVVGGGSAALIGLLNQLRPGGSDHTLLNAGLGVGGLGAATYGMSGGQPEKIMPAIKGLFSGVQTPAAAPASTTTSDPRLAKYMDESGNPNMQNIVKATDDELKPAVSALTPAQKAQLQTKLQGFKPSLGQRLGATAMGINIDQQRERFGKLLQ